MADNPLTPRTHPERTPVRPNSGSFQKGRAKTGGRKKGTPNRIAASAMQAIWAGLAAAGFDDKGKDSVEGFVKKLAIKDPARASILLLALVPRQLKLESRTHHVEEQRTVADLRSELVVKGVPRDFVELLEAPPPIENEYDGEYGASAEDDDDVSADL